LISATREVIFTAATETITITTGIEGMNQTREVGVVDMKNVTKYSRTFRMWNVELLLAISWARFCTLCR
jgi:hypothetical protein